MKSPEEIAANLKSWWEGKPARLRPYGVLLSAAATAAECACDELVAGRVDDARVYAEAYRLLRAERWAGRERAS